MEKKNQPGRPKKNKTILKTDFPGNLNKPQYEGAINEIRISESCVLIQYLKTFKTLKVNDLDIYFLPEKFVIKASIDNRLNGGIGGDKNIYVEIKKNNVYSYYCSKPAMIHIKSIINLESLMEEIDENTKFLDIFVTNISNILSYRTHDETNDIVTESSIDAEYIQYNFPELCLQCPEDVRISVLGYKPSDLKKIFNKKIRKKCYCKLKAKNNVINMDFVPEVGKITKITINANNTREIKSYDMDLYEINLPKTDVNQFMMHVKEDVSLYFSDKALFMQNEIGGLSLSYIIPIKIEKNIG